MTLCLYISQQNTIDQQKRKREDIHEKDNRNKRVYEKEKSCVLHHAHMRQHR